MGADAGCKGKSAVVQYGKNANYCSNGMNDNAKSYKGTAGSKFQIRKDCSFTSTVLETITLPSNGCYNAKNPAGPSALTWLSKAAKKKAKKVTPTAKKKATKPAKANGPVTIYA